MSAFRAAVTELSEISRHISNKGRSWGPTLGCWGAGAALVGLFLTDWKVITGNIPYIKDKYEHKPPK